MNKALHETEDNRQGILEVEVNSQIARLYVRGPDAFGTSMTTLLKWSEQALIQLPLAYKTQWVATASIAQAKCDKQKAGPYSSKCQYMKTWVIWNNTNNGD